MDPINLIIGGVIAAVILLVLFFLSRQRPNSAQQYLLLENPLMRKATGHEAILDRWGLTPGMRVLEVGCGTGRLAVPLARRVGIHGEVVALDTQERLLKRLRKRLKEADLPQLKPLYADIETVGLEKDSFDMVTMTSVLGVIDDPKKALRQVMRFLKPGGVVAVTEIIFTSGYISRRRAAKLLRLAGFREQRIVPGKVTYTIIYVKPERQVDPWREANRGIDLT